jgi:hypothetical protein
MKMSREWRYGIVPPFLTSALDSGNWSASLPSRFKLGEWAPSNHRIGGWVGPRAGLDASNVNLL